MSDDFYLVITIRLTDASSMAADLIASPGCTTSFLKNLNRLVSQRIADPSSLVLTSTLQGGLAKRPVTVPSCPRKVVTGVSLVVSDHSVESPGVRIRQTVSTPSGLAETKRVGEIKVTSTADDCSAMHKTCFDRLVSVAGDIDVKMGPTGSPCLHRCILESIDRRSHILWSMLGW